MTSVVADTNVAIVANGRHTHADDKCRLACVQRLKSLVEKEVIAIDDRGLILDEYRGYWNFSREPSVGDIFFKHVFDNQYQDDRFRRVTVTPSRNDRRGFEELPDNAFDRSDRKFLAVAVVAEAVVLNATDGDWGERAALMNELGVEVVQLCPQHASRQSCRGQ